MKLTLDLRTLTNPAAIQEYLTEALSFPDYYGKNLDALHDMLASWPYSTNFVLRFPSAPAPEAAAYLPRLLQVFEDSADENRSIQVSVRR